MEGIYSFASDAQVLNDTSEVNNCFSSKYFFLVNTDKKALLYASLVAH